jgi:hypothetical protein
LRNIAFPTQKNEWITVARYPYHMFNQRFLSERREMMSSLILLFFFRGSFVYVVPQDVASDSMAFDRLQIFEAHFAQNLPIGQSLLGSFYV